MTQVARVNAVSKKNLRTQKKQIIYKGPNMRKHHGNI